MAVIFAIATFLLFLGVDYLVQRRAASVADRVDIPSAGGLVPALEPVWVAGYQFQDKLHYHGGHTWVRSLGGDLVAVGMDDFARKLLGNMKQIKLPAVGAWLEQGGETVAVEAGKRHADLVSPVNGEVVEVNREVRSNASIAGQDPYGRGWLFKVRVGNLSANLRNLLSGSLAKRWFEDSREQLEHRLMAATGSVLQDGGEPAPNFADELDAEDWRELVQKFLLT